MLHARADDDLNGEAPVTPRIGVWQLLGHAGGQDAITDAYAWTIASWCQPDTNPFVPALGLDYSAFLDLLRSRFPQFTPPPDWLRVQRQAVGHGGALDEFPDLLQLLIDHCAVNDEGHRRMAHLVATACMGNDHLWQDLGLPSRKELSDLMSHHFPALAAKNANDMKWKKFLYRLLCERDGYIACSRPSCAGCADYSNCFGREE
jgi:nitrogen fixation protein NifQ